MNKHIMLYTLAILLLAGNVNAFGTYILGQGETIDFNDKEVTLLFAGQDSVKLLVDGVASPVINELTSTDVNGIIARVDSTGKGAMICLLDEQSSNTPACLDPDFIEEGATETLSHNDLQYEITNLDTSGDDVKFLVNGNATPVLTDAQTALVGGARLYVHDASTGLATLTLETIELESNSALDITITAAATDGITTVSNIDRATINEVQDILEDAEYSEAAFVRYADVDFGEHDDNLVIIVKDNELKFVVGDYAKSKYVIAAIDVATAYYDIDGGSQALPVGMAILSSEAEGKSIDELMPDEDTDIIHGETIDESFTDTLTEGQQKRYSFSRGSFVLTPLVVSTQYEDKVKFKLGNQYSSVLEEGDTWYTHFEEDISITVKEIITVTQYRDTDPRSIVEFTIRIGDSEPDDDEDDDTQSTSVCNDFSCYARTAKTCKPTNGEIESTFELFSMIVETEQIITTAPVNGGCQLRIFTEEQEVRFTDEYKGQLIAQGITDYEIANMEDKAETAKNTYQTCVLSTERLSELFSQWAEGKFSSKDLVGTGCEELRQWKIDDSEKYQNPPEKSFLDDDAPDSPKTFPEPACEGCEGEDLCYPIGTRLKDDGASKYCDISGNLMEQKADGLVCENNFECLTNQCSSGVCIDLKAELEETRGLLRRFLDWVDSFW